MDGSVENSDAAYQRLLRGVFPDLLGLIFNLLLPVLVALPL